MSPGLLESPSGYSASGQGFDGYVNFGIPSSESPNILHVVRRHVRAAGVAYPQFREAFLGLLTSRSVDWLVLRSAQSNAEQAGEESAGRIGVGRLRRPSGGSVDCRVDCRDSG